MSLPSGKLPTVLLRILVVEDHDGLRDATVEFLEAQGHSVLGMDCAESVDECRELARTDVALLDVGLPCEDGISLARRLREAQPALGIIMMTARHTDADKIAGYDNGADIYLTKPVSPQALLAAINALARRLDPDPLLAHAADALQLEVATRQLVTPYGRIDLTEPECRVLCGLARANDHQLESWQLIELLGKDLDHYSKANLEVLIVRLRKKLGLAGATDHGIKSVRGRGYLLRRPVILI